MISNEFSVKSVGTLKVILLNLSENMRKAFHYKWFNYVQILFTTLSEGKVGF